jgi:NAD(P)-dependent dehydrogenase (short-subunit alcohol dehydrogenase family)
MPAAAGIFAVGAGPVYAAAKAGVVHFTRSLAPRLAKHKISLTAVCPQANACRRLDCMSAAPVLN